MVYVHFVELGRGPEEKLADHVEPGDVRSKCFRHTYCATRLQTLDGGKPVAVYTVSRELGHSSTAMVEGVYSHLGSARHRSDVVEYRVEAFADILGQRLAALRVGAAAGDTEPSTVEVSAPVRSWK